MADAQKRLDERVEKIRQDPDLDAQTKNIMVRNRQEVENRRLEVEKAGIEADKDAKILASKEKMEAQIRAIQSRVRTMAVIGPPIPVFILGVLIFLRRRKREKEGAVLAHRLRG